MRACDPISHSVGQSVGPLVGRSVGLVSRLVILSVFRKSVASLFYALSFSYGLLSITKLVSEMAELG